VPASESAPPRPGSGEFFDTIADRYDLLNRILSLGFDLRWRAHAVRTLALEPGRCVLDLATGTADLAIACALACPGIEVLGLDLSPRMLEIGARKVARRRLQSRIRLELGDAQRLDRLPDASFDAVTMAFGIRNLPDREAALREMRRVAKPGAPIAILELSEPRGGLFAPLARSHIHVLVPWVGGLLSGAEAYRYLQRSIAAFPPPEAIVAAMRKAGIEHPRAEPLTFGVCHLYVGRAGKGAPS
jgi:demethylmenaquinone methyltransferase/2-methoxy-6-polyprenyl-1,4-benzoquinol methylase